MASPRGGARLGTRFGPYELRSLIGVGGMGEVYRAFDTQRDRMVAVKLLRPEVAADPSFQERFRRESRVAARLQEPHVIPVHDFGAIDGVLYIDMRLVDGASVKEVLRAEGPLEPARAAAIIAQVGAALDAAHAGGLVHRDIKPENVLLTSDDFAYLVDFGIAHAGEDASVTMTGMVIGSCAYMAAERFSGGPVGPPSDIYALACLLYECLTGRPPFEAGDLRQLMSAHMFAAPPRPSAVRRGVSRAFDDVVARGMAKQPEARFASAGDLARAATAAAASSQAPAADAGPPAATRQFSALYPNPVATGYTPYPPPRDPAPAPAPKATRRRFGSTQVTLVAVTVLLLGVAAVLAALLMSGDDGAGGSGRTPLAVPPSTSTTAEATEPSAGETSTTSSTTPTTTSSTTTSSTSTTPGSVDMAGADTQGFVGHSARCDSGDTAAAMVRTANSLAVVCDNGGNSYYYRGERLRDGANLEIADAVPAGGGFDAVNPADGARYQVRPDRLTILSNGGVDSTEPALQYAAP